MLTSDTGRAPFGTDDDRRRVEQAREPAGWKPDPLGDAVSLSLGEDFARLTLLLLVPRESPVPLHVELRTGKDETLDRRRGGRDAPGHARRGRRGPAA